ncbi:hypothetical protein [Bifidobacterium sp. ESL0764]|uniref:hypothetical protein n=1 Tax=Bifidobacterium sp. ESL0764 TaxID=2983228 RepID=UPI0023F76A5B|nr:hypothetical protein [Bifidobacterium sp. ESL0764]WEV65622.1 hypothetical protein OZX71_07710 [Bifidobacterium sp. ESL0764]
MGEKKLVAGERMEDDGVVESLEDVLTELRHQQDFRRHQVDISIQQSQQLIGFASLTSALISLSTVQAEWCKWVRIFSLVFLLLAIGIGVFDLCKPGRNEKQPAIKELRDKAAEFGENKNRREDVLLDLIDNISEDEKNARKKEDERIGVVHLGYVFLGIAILLMAIALLGNQVVPSTR